MAIHFYEVVDDMNHPAGWWLGAICSGGAKLDAGMFTRGQPVDGLGELTVSVKRPGTPLPFSFTLRDVPVVATKVADLIDTVAPGSIQRFPVEIEETSGRYDLINVVRVIDAIDRERSEYILWKPEDGRPDKVNTFRQVTSLVVKRDIRKDAGIFRPHGWTVALVISEQLKLALDGLKVRGVTFRPLREGDLTN